MPIRSLLLAAVLAAGACLPVFAAPSAGLPPAADFFEDSSFSGAALSPSGRYLAALVSSRVGRDALAVIALLDNKGQLVASFPDADVGKVRWLNDDQLLFDSTDRRLAPGDRQFGPGLYTVSRDGKNFRQLADRSGGVITNGRATNGGIKLLPWHTFMLGQMGRQDSAFAYVLDAHFDNTGVYRSEDLLRLNTENGRTTLVERPAAADFWLLDQRGEPRLAASTEKNERVYWLRDSATGPWRVLTKYAAFGADRRRFAPLDFGPDGKLYVVSAQGRDHTAVYTLDTATGAVAKEPVMQVEGHDFQGRLIANADRLLGIRYLTDTWGTAWFDPAMKAVQADVDGKLQDTINLIDVPRQPDAPNLLVTAYSDVQPTVYYVYHRQTGQLNKAGARHERIRAAQMGRQQWTSYAARDGLPIPALLTLPAGVDKPSRAPMVVLVHGGPWVRGAEWGWNAEAQFLASRGYLVLQPEFRGSTGFGSRHFTAGLKEWGRKMQDDLADGTRWAIAQGYADPQRVCIAGASYGGYATLMGLVRDPDLYRCGVEWAGVTDLKLMYTGAWSVIDDMSSQYRQYGMPRLIGDPVKDAEQLKAASPIEQAARIRKPLLMAYGGEDLRVPLQHGTRLRDAIRAHNSDVEWIVYDAEGHGWSTPANQVDFWTRVERFLGRQIGNR
ncbi:dipeptidyl aminopeptidase/acylaminoacyl peptidase [Pseudoduganella lurida]|uniref:Dipeptidyl aminopeptidase/acylaminoacyl peptidase n=1 Tax=Pseudoduganella lurida TaxID=1036180 RepID=A0A562RAK1_9BURK|nr:prolyl oligopeptidase family serine peptidase [Pseudoduganella lurida]TWI66109.1 dipeptidyl aminopeptidase/acylaminoacyl peptidase [Pseudoduganella lurida]